MIRSLFLSMGELNKGARRPADVAADRAEEDRRARRRLHGRRHRLCRGQRRDRGRADRPRPGIGRQRQGHSDKRRRARRSPRAAPRPPTRTRCWPASRATADYAALKGCDLVVEAVFEDRAVKAEATQEGAGRARRRTSIFASNTSTLPITSLAETSPKPENFIGVHFFSPVDKMMLVEIIMGEKTGARRLATAMDFVRAIKKTPIVVNDCRGFFVNRCVGNYMLEGHLDADGRRAAGDDRERRADGRHAGRAAGAQRRGRRRSRAGRSCRRPKKDLGAQRGRSGAGEADRGDGGARSSASAARTARAFTTTRRAGRRALWPGLAEFAGKRARSRHDRRAGAEGPLPRTRRRWRRRAAWRRASSPTRARPTSARSSASASRPSPAARCRSSTAWARKPSSRAPRSSRRNTGRVRAEREARPDGRARRDVLRDLRREAEGGVRIPPLVGQGDGEGPAMPSDDRRKKRQSERPGKPPPCPRPRHSSEAGEGDPRRDFRLGCANIAAERGGPGRGRPIAPQAPVFRHRSGPRLRAVCPAAAQDAPSSREDAVFRLGAWPHAPVSGGSA